MASTAGIFSRRAKPKVVPHLHHKHVLQVLASYLRVLQPAPNVVHVSTAVSQCVTIVGDLHGQLRDLEMIFQQNGMPSATNPLVPAYIFNGDLVDRGTHSLEICVILFGLAVADPSCVRINRGNHEDYSVCDTYGFTDEIFAKYPEDEGVEIAELFAEVFAFLPIACVVDQSTFVVHGGLGRYSLKFLGDVPRHHFKTLQGVPGELWEGRDYGDVKHCDWEALMDAVWSDPQKEAGIQANAKRGAGACWGPDYTALWLKHEGLNEVIRSHECCEFGYELHHGDKCMTLFSASNYYAGESNWGAFAKLSAVMKGSETMAFKSSVTLHQFVVDDVLPQDGSPAPTRAPQNAKASVERVRLILYEYKTQLAAEFEAADVDQSGELDLFVWASIMERVITIKLPWLHLRPDFIELRESEGRKVVDYASFMEELRASFKSVGTSMEVPIPEYIYKMLPELEACFRLLDQTGSGTVSAAEFDDACGYLDLAQGSPMAAADKAFLLQQLDPRKTGKISFVAFLNSVRFECLDTSKDRGESDEEMVILGPGGLPERYYADGACSEDDGDDAETLSPRDSPRSVAPAAKPQRLRPRALSVVIKKRGARKGSGPKAQVDSESRRVRSCSAVGKLNMKNNMAGNAFCRQIAESRANAGAATTNS
ncbi:Metallo-dependent phosphatase-like protein [Pelagophyceae sp. CCMP2097]|nr:Metallo-dependent phosphatase-like protein [Pelagophyceae sp. CCMP2097]